MKNYKEKFPPCFNGLFEKDYSFNVGAGATVASSVTLPKQRGDVWALSMVASGANESDLHNCLITLDDNGKSMIEEATALAYSSYFANSSKRNIIDIHMEQGGELNYRFVNGGAATVRITITLYFVYPEQLCG